MRVCVRLLKIRRRTPRTQVQHNPSVLSQKIVKDSWYDRIIEIITSPGASDGRHGTRAACHQEGRLQGRAQRRAGDARTFCAVACCAI
jgi:hypothetical protein